MKRDNQRLLRHSNVRMTRDVCVRAMTPAKLDAQGWVSEQLLAAEVKSPVERTREFAMFAYRGLRPTKREFKWDR
jgi:hypothetical protein